MCYFYLVPSLFFCFHPQFSSCPYCCCNWRDGNLDFCNWDTTFFGGLSNGVRSTHQWSPVSNAYFSTVFEQALPKFTVNDHNIISILGDFVSLNNFKNGLPFLDPSTSRSSIVTCDNLSRLKGWQAGVNEWIPNRFDSVFPFVDLYPGSILPNQLM